MSPQPHLRTLEVDNLSTSLDNTWTILMSLVALPVRVASGLGVWRPAPLLLLLLLVQLAATQNADCPYLCTPLTQCPNLLLLLEKPTAENLLTLRQRTCSKGDDPLVCCPQTPLPPSSLLPKDCGQGTQLGMIFGGTEAPIYSHPWLALLGYSDPGGKGKEFLCGGTVINKRYVLTTATCVNPVILHSKELKVIRLGEWDLSTEEDCEVTQQGFRHCAPPPEDFTYEKITIHPNYDTRQSSSDDIALIRLSRPIDFSGQWIQPVCMPPRGLDGRRMAGQREPLLAGWGRTENRTSSDRLLQVNLPFVDDKTCNDTYRGKLVEGQMCLGGSAGRDSCSGDTGNPVVVPGPSGPPFLLIGLVSYGPSVCGTNVPAVHTSVSYYREWIVENMKP